MIGRIEFGRDVIVRIEFGRVKFGRVEFGRVEFGRVEFGRIGPYSSCSLCLQNLLQNSG